MLTITQHILANLVLTVDLSSFMVECIYDEKPLKDFFPHRLGAACCSMCGRRMHDDVNETKYLLTEEP
jgi:hypothetical protein